MYKNNSLLCLFHEITHCIQQHEFVFFACKNKENIVDKIIKKYIEGKFMTAARLPSLKELIIFHGAFRVYSREYHCFFYNK